MSVTTKERIFAIADDLDANGQNPTLAAVRKALGAGSFTTISEAMTEWKAKKAAKERPVSEPAPQVVADRLSDLGGEIWALALEVADGRLAAERDVLDAVRVQLEAEKGESAELADQVTAELEAMKGRMAALEAAEAGARQEADGLRLQVAVLADKASTAEARAVEIEKRADDLNAELSRVNQQNGDLVKALAESATGKATTAKK